MSSTPKPVVEVEASWGSFPLGIFVIGTSVLDGPDTLGVTPFDDSFGGPYDLLDCRRFEITQGRSAPLAEVEAGAMTVDVADPDGLLNPENPDSPIAAQLDDRLHPIRARSRSDGLGALTFSGGIIDDVMRTLGIQGDGRPVGAGIGIWPGTTNDILNGGSETNSNNWAARGAAVKTRVLEQPKYGLRSQKVVTTGAAGDGVGDPGASTPVVAGVTHTFSIWVYSLTARAFTVNWSNYTAGLAFVSNVGGVVNHGGTGYERLTFTAVTPATTAFVSWWIDNFTAPLAFTYWADAAQMEASPFATPYVHTDGATATRLAARVQGPKPPDATQGSVAMRVRPGWPATAQPYGAGNDPRVFSWVNGATDLIELTYQESSDTWRLERRGASVSDAVSSAAQGFAAGDLITLIAKWTATTLGISVNGAPFVTIAASNIPAGLGALADIGNRAAGDRALAGEVLWGAAGPGTLTNADAANIHAQLVAGARPSYPSEVKAQMGVLPSWVWPAKDAAIYLADQKKGLFYGWVRSIQWEPEAKGRRGTAQLECVDLFYWLNRAKPVIAATGAITTGAAIGLILDWIGWTVPALRALDAGDLIPSFQADGTKTGLQLIADLLVAEFGLFYVSGDGVATYKSRTTLRSSGSVATIRDRMKMVAPGLDADYVKTRATVQRTGGVAQSSINLEAERRWASSASDSITTPYLFSDQRAKDIADWLVTTRGAEPKAPVRSVVIGNSEADLLRALLNVDQGDRVTLSESRGGSEGDYTVEQRVLTGDGTRYQAAWIVSRASTSPLFRLDTDVLDGAGTLAF